MILTALIASACALSAGTWRTDPAWYDGRAEVCVYEATRTIYGVERRYEARAYTNKELLDERRGVKAEGQQGLEVFKHHWSERVPTEKYDYDFSTMSYARTSDLSPWKLTAATQDDCGASFKEVWRVGSGYAFWESVYFPGAGRRSGELERGFVFFDALPLTLRDYDFEAKRDLVLAVLPSQKDVRAVSFVPERRTVRFAGTAELDLPIGKLRAHELVLLRPDGSTEARYWFDADGSAPALHVLVRHEGPGGVGYRLARRERSAYWER
ncbi:MAG: hypothetical protein JNK02_14950 [Planctomycetes bacterium]|nr:hypothetical protein [Planctomycetota bacterium]